MSFREKVKDLLEAGRDANEFRRKSAKLVARKAQARIDAASKKSKEKLKKEDEEAKAKRKKSRKYDVFESVKKKSKTTVTMPKGTIKVDGKEYMSQYEIDRKAARVAAAKKSKPESTTENSNHPFYQKVKALSRGKKNNSLLEKKSNSIKTFKILLGTVGKKSKMDEAKKKSKKKKQQKEMLPFKKSKEEELDAEIRKQNAIAWQAEAKRRMHAHGRIDVPGQGPMPGESKDKKKKMARSSFGRYADRLGLGHVVDD